MNENEQPTVNSPPPPNSNDAVNVIDEAGLRHYEESVARRLEDIKNQIQNDPDYDEIHSQISSLQTEIAQVSQKSDNNDANLDNELQQINSNLTAEIEKIKSELSSIEQNTGSIAINPNLLNNWYFSDPVNQPGSTTYTISNNITENNVFDFYLLSMYNFDSGAKCTLTLNDGYITISLPVANTNCSVVLYDRPEKDLSIYNSDYLTLSIVYRMPKGSAAFGLYYDYAAKHYYYSTDLKQSEDFTIAKYRIARSVLKDIRERNFMIRLFANPTEEISIDIMAIKLEKGEEQTLARVDDSGKVYLLEIPNKNAELYNAMRKYELLYLPSAAIVGVRIPYKVKKDKNPTIIAYNKSDTAISNAISYIGTKHFQVSTSNLYWFRIDARD